jgi:hypothetical protein
MLKIDHRPDDITSAAGVVEIEPASSPSAVVL